MILVRITVEVLKEASQGLCPPARVLFENQQRCWQERSEVYPGETRAYTVDLGQHNRLTLHAIGTGQVNFPAYQRNPVGEDS